MKSCFVFNGCSSSLQLPCGFSSGGPFRCFNTPVPNTVPCIIQGISDPGSALVESAARAGITVVPVPGPSAVLAGLVGSGLPTEEFMFLGFLPPKATARKQRLRKLVGTLQKPTLLQCDGPSLLGPALTRCHSPIPCHE